MSTSIDQRIVEMQFDNNQFERGAKQSIETLDKLDKSLDLRESAKNLTALSDAGKNFNMDGVASGIEIVQQKFSALEIVGITALQRITNQAITTGENLVKSLSLDQIGEGFGKYEQKTTSVQTIVNATGESIDSVSEKLAKLNWFTDETSYNFTDMIGNIGKFTSMGIDLNTSVTAMEGIANWAAISGQGVNEASRAMYNLSQAIGVGAVKLMDWKSIENANMATKEFKETAIETAKALGELNAQGETAKGTAVTVENFSSTLSDAWFTSDVLLKTLNKYGEYADEVYTVATEKGLTCAQAMEQVNGETMNLGERAFKAAQEAKTFTDAINSVKDAVSTGWANTFEIIFGNYEEAKRMWTDLANDLYDIFAGGTDDRNNFLEQVFGANNASIDETAWSKLFQNGIGGDAFKNAVSETAKAHGVAIDEMIAQEGDFQATLKKGWLTVDLVKETLAKYNGEVVTSTENVNDKLAEFNDLATKVIKGSYGNGAARKKALEEAGYDYAQIQSMVNKVLAGTQLTVEDLTEEQLKAVGATDEQTKALQELAKQAEETGTPLNDLLEELNRPTGRDLMIQSAANALQMVKQQMDIVKGSWDDVFPPVTAEQVYKLMQRIEKLSEKLVLSDDNADKLKRTLKGLFSVFGIVKDAVTKLTKSGLKVLNALIGDVNLNILDYTSNIGDHIVGLREWLNTNTKLNAVMDKGTSFLVNGITKVKSFGAEHQILQKSINAVRNILTLAIRTGKKWFESFKELPTVQNGFKKLSEMFQEGLKTGKELIDEFSPALEDFFEKLTSTDGITFDDIVQLFENLKISGGQALDTLNQKWEQFTGNLTGFKTNVDNTIGLVRNKFEDAKKAADEFLGGLFSTANTKISKFGLTKFIGILVSGGVLKTLYDLSIVFSKVGKATDSVKDTAVGVLREFKNVLVAYQKQIMAGNLLKIAGAIAILTGSLIALTFVDQNKLFTSISALSSLALGLTALIATMGILEKTGRIANPKGFGLTVVALSASVLMIVKALKDLEDLEGETLLKRLSVLGAISGALVAFMAGLNSINKFIGAGSIGTALQLIATALALKIVLSSLNDLEKYNIDALTNSIKKIALLMGTLAITASLAGKGSIGGALSILALAFGLKYFISLFEEIAALDLSSIKENLSSFTIVFGTFAGLMAASGEVGPNASKGGAAILMISASLLIILEAFRQLSELNPKDVVIGTVFVAAVIRLFDTFMVLSKFAGDNIMKAGVGIAAMSASLILVAGSLAILTLLDQNKLGNALACLTIITGLLSGMMAVSQFAKGSEKVILSIGVVVAGIAAVMFAMSLMDSEELDNATNALSKLMICLGIVMGMSQFAGKSKVGLVLITAAVAALGYLLYVMQDKIKNTSRLVPIAESLSLLLLAMSGAMAILNNIPFTGALNAAANLTAFMTVMAGAMEGIGFVLQYVDEDGSNMDRFVNFMEDLGGAIGGFIGNFGAGLTDGFGRIGENLSAFAKNATDFIDMLDKVDSSKIDGVKNLVDVITMLGAVQIGNALSGLYNQNGYEWFKDALNQISLGFDALSTNMKSVSITDVNKVTKLTDAMDTVLEFATKIPITGGKLQEFFGSKNLDSFGQGLASFGGYFATYAESVAGIDTEVVTVTSAAAKTITDFADAINKSGGFLQSLVGNQNLDMFGSQLAVFGQNFAQYASYVEGITEDCLAGSSAAANTIIELSNAIPSSGGLKMLVTGDNNIGTFGKNLADFGANFKTYYNNICNMDPKKLMFATNGIKGLVDIVDLLDGKNVSQLWTMGQAMQDLFSVDEGMYNNLELLYSNMQKTGETMIDRLMQGITNKAPNVKLTAQQTITNIIGDMATQIGTDQTVVIQAFEGMLNAAIEYLNSRTEDFGKYISTVCDEMITAMSDRYDDFANAGSYVIGGFVKGMKDAKMDAITAASNIALDAYSAACDTLDIHSPSKKFAWIGMQTDMGLAQGMLKYGRVAKEAAKRTASETVNAAQNSIYGIRGMFDGIDLTPVIRPIVDLDAVKNGVAQLNGMTTGMNTGLRLDTAYAYVSSAAASMDAKKASENQNGLEKVANELKALRDNPPVTMNNKFDITNPDPEAVANKAVSKIVRQIGRDTSRG